MISHGPRGLRPAVIQHGPRGETRVSSIIILQDTALAFQEWRREHVTRPRVTRSKPQHLQRSYRTTELMRCDADRRRIIDRNKHKTKLDTENSCASHVWNISETRLTCRIKLYMILSGGTTAASSSVDFMQETSRQYEIFRKGKSISRSAVCHNKSVLHVCTDAEGLRRSRNCFVSL